MSHLVNGPAKAADTRCYIAHHNTEQRTNVSLASRRADSEVRSYKLKLYSLAVYVDGPVSLWVGCVRLCMCTGTCVYVCVCACMYVCVHVHACMCMCMCAWLGWGLEAGCYYFFCLMFPWDVPQHIKTQQQGFGDKYPPSVVCVCCNMFSLKILQRTQTHEVDADCANIGVEDFFVGIVV